MKLHNALLLLAPLWLAGCGQLMLTEDKNEQSYSANDIEKLRKQGFEQPTSPFYLGIEQTGTRTDNVVRLYGPGGPHTALIAAGEVFTEKTGIPVEVHFGPERRWTVAAQDDADILFGSAEQSMTAFMRTYTFLNDFDVEPIAVREAGFLVKTGNPKNIQEFDDVLKDGVRIVVTEGQGIYNTSGTGVWEDIAGRKGDLDDIKRFRANIVAFEMGSGAGFAAFKEKGDVWLSWCDWAKSNPGAAEFIPLDEDRKIYRDMNVAISKNAKPEARQFVDFLQSDAALESLNRYCWTR